MLAYECAYKSAIVAGFFHCIRLDSPRKCDEIQYVKNLINIIAVEAAALYFIKL